MVCYANNVVVTSHQAFLTHKALTAEMTLENLGEFEQGRRGAELTNAARNPSQVQGCVKSVKEAHMSSGRIQ